MKFPATPLILRTLLPPPTAQNYTLRNRQLPGRISPIIDCNFGNHYSPAAGSNN